MKKYTTCIKALLVLSLIFILSGCGKENTESLAIEPLSDEEYSFYADNINCYGDDVVDSDMGFLYVQLPCSPDSERSDDELKIADDNADGIISMIKLNYHDVLDLRNTEKSLPSEISRVIPAERNVLLIGDDFAEELVLELSEHFESLTFMNSARADYDRIYEDSLNGDYDFVIIANDTTAFREHVFPYSS